MSEMLEAAPLFLWSLLFLLLLAGAHEAGVRLRRRPRRAAEPGDGDTGSDEGYALSAVLGLMALLIAFTFSLALGRYEERRGLVVVEANALGTAWLRTSLLSSPEPVRAAMRAYGEARLDFGRGSDPAKLEQRTGPLQAALWRETVAALQPDRHTALVPAVLTPINEAFDTATARKAEGAARIPARVLLTLIVYGLAVAFVLGYAARDGRRRMPSYALFAMFTLSTTLILDLDQPGTGTIQVPQAAMEEAVRSMR
ncbi:MAG TPA: hypothetical protein VIT45_14400 [Allosphingosinicella sp.]